MSYKLQGNPIAGKTKLWGSLSLVCLGMDAGFSACFFCASNGWFRDGLVDPKAVFWDSILNFRTDTSDMLLLCLVRLIVVPLVFFLAKRAGTPRSYAAAEEALKQRRRQQSNFCVKVPLLSDFASDERMSHPAYQNYMQNSVNGTKSESKRSKKARLSKALKDQEEEKLMRENPEEWHKRERDRATKRMNIWFVLLFLFCTFMSVFTGIKTVGFKQNNVSDILQAVFFFAVVILVNTQFVFIKMCVEAIHSEEGILLPKLHLHPLTYVSKKPCHWCDVCKSRITGIIYRCNMCDFDCCKSCFIKASLKQAKNKAKSKQPNLDTAAGLKEESRHDSMRGDKGKRKEKKVTTWGYFVRSIRLVKAHTHVLIIALVCLCVNQGANLLMPNYQGRILDSVFKQDSEKFKSLMYIYVALNVSMGIFSALQQLCILIIGRRMSTSVRNQLYCNILNQDIAFFDALPTGQLTSRLSNDSSAMVGPCQTALNVLLSNTIQLFGGLFMCLHTNWRLSMLAFTSIAPIIYITGVYATWSRGIQREIWQALGDAMQVATEAISNIRTVRAFSTEAWEKEKFLTALAVALYNGIKDSWVGASVSLVTNYIDLGATILILWYGGTIVMESSSSSSLTAGDLVAFQLYWNMINSAYKSLNGVINSFTRAGAAAQRVFSLMDSMPDIDPNAGERVSNLQGNITLRDVKFTYQMRPENEILKGINLDIKAGSTLALVGRSGGGKTTIVNLIMRMYDPNSGSIQFDGKDLRDLNLKSVHNHIGLVSQDTQLFYGTIVENIAYGAEPGTYTSDDIRHAAKLANADDFIMEFDEGYQTRVGERGTRLSGGQKQRIAIARVIFRKAKVLLLDEATSSLDTESEALVQKAIDGLMDHGQRTVILVAHRLSTVINADVIAVVDKGTIREKGSHNELLKLNGVYSKLVNHQIQKASNTLDQSAKPEDVNIDQLLDEVKEEEVESKKDIKTLNNK